MQGLRHLYGHTGRRAEWKRLVEEIVPDFIDPDNDGPLPGREEDWSLVTEYRVRLTLEERQWAKAERLQTVLVEWNRQRAGPALDRPPEELENEMRNSIRSLAVSLGLLGYIRREIELESCVPAYEESLELNEDIGDQAGAATCAFNLGYAFMALPALRNLDHAERWCRRSLELYGEREPHDRGQCLGLLGAIAYERFREARTTGRPEEELLHFLTEAVRLYQEALGLLPADAVNDLAVFHNQLGILYEDTGDLDRAIHHHRKSIFYEEVQRNIYGAARARRNMAIALLNTDRRADALEYAEAALREFESYGERGAEMIERTRGLIAEIRGG